MVFFTAYITDQQKNPAYIFLGKNSFNAHSNRELQRKKQQVASCLWTHAHVSIHFLFTFWLLPLEPLPLMHLLFLVNIGPTQLISIEILSNIVTDTPSVLPVHPPLLFRTMGTLLLRSLLSWLQTTTQMYRKQRKIERRDEKRSLREAQPLRGWRSSGDHFQGLSVMKEGCDFTYPLLNDK